MPFTVDIAGDVNGDKRNLRVRFPSGPTLNDITTAAEALFTAIGQAEAKATRLDNEFNSDSNTYQSCLHDPAGATVLSRNAISGGNSSSGTPQRHNSPAAAAANTVGGSSSGGAPYPFVVASVAVLDDVDGAWVRVAGGSQVHPGDQLYCFQPRGRWLTPVAVARSSKTAAAASPGDIIGYHSYEAHAERGALSYAAGHQPSITVLRRWSAGTGHDNDGTADSSTPSAAMMMTGTAVDALLEDEAEADHDGPGDIPPPERLVIWGGDSDGDGVGGLGVGVASLFAPVVAAAMAHGHQPRDRSPVLPSVLPPPPPSQQRHPPLPVEEEEAEGVARCLNTDSAAASQSQSQQQQSRQQPMFLRPTESSVRRERQSPQPQEPRHSHNQRHTHHRRKAQLSEAHMDTGSSGATATATAEQATLGVHSGGRSFPHSSVTAAPSPLPIPAATAAYYESQQGDLLRRQKQHHQQQQQCSHPYAPSTPSTTSASVASPSPPSYRQQTMRVEHHPYRQRRPHNHHRQQQQQQQPLLSPGTMDFADKARYTFAILPEEPRRPSIILRDLFAFAKHRGQLSRWQLLFEAHQQQQSSSSSSSSLSRWGLYADGGGSLPPTSLSPFFLDRLAGALPTTSTTGGGGGGHCLEGVLRAADRDRDGCIGYAEWVGYCLECPAVLELILYYALYGEPSSFTGGVHQQQQRPAGLGRAWEQVHLLPARVGCPRCEACEEITAWLPGWGGGSGHGHECRRHKGNDTCGNAWQQSPLPPPPPPPPEASPMHADPFDPLGPASPLRQRQRAWQPAPSPPYPSAMPRDDFTRRVGIMRARDSLGL